MHVNEMLNEMTVDEFIERYAAWQLSGEGERLQHVSWIITTICNQVTRYMASKTRDDIPESAYMSPDELMPKHMRAKRKRRGIIRPGDKNAAERLAKHLGAI